jgi:hypothetical protein
MIRVSGRPWASKGWKYPEYLRKQYLSQTSRSCQDHSRPTSINSRPDESGHIKAGPEEVIFFVDSMCKYLWHHTEAISN